jgi:DNA helicase-2/ATP-dependent DNA helicase PcrA
MEVKLSEKQKNVVESSSRAILVLAHAGSGKTRILTEKIKHVVNNYKHKVLAVTFTNKAAEEMLTRLQDVPNIKERAFIGTLHKFALELLHAKGYVIGFQNTPHIFEKLDDRREILSQIINDNYLLKNAYSHKSDKERNVYLADLIDYISQKKRSLCEFDNPFDAFDAEKDLVAVEYDTRMLLLNAIDFDDVINLAYKILFMKPATKELYQKIYKFICVDEAQDLNFAQYQLLKLLGESEESTVMMVGDPNQAIYGFSGSSKDFMLKNFAGDFKPEEFHLTENFRSSKKVLKLANKFITGDEIIADNATLEGGFQLRNLENEEQEAVFVCDTVENLLKIRSHNDIEGEINLEKIAILARSKYIFKNIEEELRKRDIKVSYQVSSERFEHESTFMRIFDLGLRVINNPNDTLHLNQLTGLLGIESISVNSSGLDSLKTVLDLINDKNDQEKYRVLLDSWRIVLDDEENYPKALKNLKDSIQNLVFTDTEELDLIAYDLEEESKYWRQYLSNTSSGNRSISAYRNQKSLGLNVNRNKLNNALTLATIHSVKGLEFDIVFIIGLTEGAFPDYRAKSQKEINEEKNNFYVAITRARRLLYMTYPESKITQFGNIKKQTPSTFLGKLGLL